MELEWKLRFRYICILQKSLLLELTLNFQISFVFHLNEAVHILYKPLSLSVWKTQLSPYTTGCKTQIAFIFKNIFNAASLSCYIILTVKNLKLLNKQPPLFYKNIPTIKHHLNKLLHRIEITKWHLSCGENVLFKILHPTVVKNDPLKT